MKVSEELMLFQKEQNYTLEELSNLLGVCKSSIHGYLKGTRKPSLKNLQKIASLLKVNPAYFLNIEEKNMLELTFMENLRKEPEVYDYFISHENEEIDRIKKQLKKTTN